MRKSAFWGVVVLAALALSIFTAACTKTTDTSTTTGAVTTAVTSVPPTSPGTTGTTLQPTTTTTLETIKIGAVISTQWALGNDMKRGIDVMIALDNANGGLSIGGKQYRVELDFIESGGEQAATVAAVDKLIADDGVRFLVTDTAFPEAVFAKTEAGNVLTVAACSDLAAFDPSYQLTFQGGTMTQAAPELSGWMARNTGGIKTIDLAYPDDPASAEYAAKVQAAFESSGTKVRPVAFSSVSADLAALGTKVAEDDPSAFVVVGDSDTVVKAYQAAVRAGYKGELLCPTWVSYEALNRALPAEALDTFVGGAWPVDFTPAITDVALAFKAKWIEMYGAWDGPDIQLTSAYAALRGALQKAGSLDVQAVARVLAAGLTFEGPTGKGEMIPRADLGITRTVDNASEVCVAKIVAGAPQLIHYITLAEGKGFLDPTVFSGATATTETQN